MTIGYRPSHPGEVEHFLVAAYGTSVRIRPHGGRPELLHRRNHAGLFGVESMP